MPRVRRDDLDQSAGIFLEEEGIARHVEAISQFATYIVPGTPFDPGNQNAAPYLHDVLDRDDCQHREGNDEDPAMPVESGGVRVQETQYADTGLAVAMRQQRS